MTVSQSAGARHPNGNFDLLRHVVGEGWADSNLKSGFPLDQLDERENFLSLLHYFGLLSIRDVRDGVPRLGIPNQTVKRLMYGYLRDAYQDVGVFAVDVYAFSRLMHEMAFRGTWRPVMDFLRDAIAAQTSIRDYIEGERVLQGFLAAYLNITDYYVFHTERGNSTRGSRKYASNRYSSAIQASTTATSSRSSTSSAASPTTKRASPQWRRRQSRSYAVTLATSRWLDSIRPSRSPDWPSCSTAGRWCAAKP